MSARFKITLRANGKKICRGLKTRCWEVSEKDISDEDIKYMTKQLEEEVKQIDWKTLIEKFYYKNE